MDGCHGLSASIFVQRSPKSGKRRFTGNCIFQIVSYFGQPSENGKKPALPPPGTPVIVQRPHCRCMAYQDRDGKWRDYFHRDELTDVIEVIPIEK
jgi:hypothetical protein